MKTKLYRIMASMLGIVLIVSSVSTPIFAEEVHDISDIDNIVSQPVDGEIYDNQDVPSKTDDLQKLGFSIKDTEIDGVKYRYYIEDDNTVRITFIETDNSSVVIPDTLSECPVTVIGTGISGSVLKKAENVTAITLPKDLLKIERFSFEESNIEKIVIPDKVTDVGSRAFFACDKLETAIINANLLSIEDGLFSGCTSLQSVNIPDSVTQIKDYAFRDCTSLININIPDGVTSIGKEAFSYCRSLGDVSLPDRLTEMGKGAFACCSITFVEIPSGLQEVPDSAFCACKTLSKITFTDSLQSIGQLAFASTAIESLTFCRDNFVINDRAFEQCDNLKSVIFDAKDICIYDKAFFGCNALNNVTFNYPITISDLSFYSCRSLKEIVIPEDSIVMGRAFVSSGLQKVTLPSSYDQVEEGTFEGCYDLTELVLGTDLVMLNEYAFCNCGFETVDFLRDGVCISSEALCMDSLKTVYLPKVVKIDGNAFGDQNYDPNPEEEDEEDYPNNITDVYYQGTKAEWEALRRDFKSETEFYSQDVTSGIYDPDGVLFARTTIHFTDDAGEVGATAVSLNKAEVTLKVGEAEALTATVLPENATNKNVSWSSSAPAIATVDNNGKVTAVSEGEAIITVTTEDGNKTATCKVIVEKAETKTYEVTFNDANGKLIKSGSVEEGALAASLIPSDEEISKCLSEGEQFTGWINVETGALWNKNSPVTGNLNLKMRVSATSSETTGSGRDPQLITVTDTSETEKYIFDAYMVKGQTCTLPAAYNEYDGIVSSAQILWKTENKKIVSISGKNKIKAVNITSGTTYVNVYDQDTLSQSGVVYRVHVVSPVLALQGQTSQTKSISLTAGDSCNLEMSGMAPYEANFSVSWISSNPEVASVEAGQVLAHSKGSAKITGYVGGKAYTCTVKVSDTKAVKKSLDNKETVSLVPLQTVSVKFSNSSFKMKNVLWKSGDDPFTAYNSKGSVASASDKISYYQNSVVRVTPAGKLTGVGVGTATLEAVDAQGTSQTLTVKVDSPAIQYVHVNSGKNKTIKFYNVKAAKAIWKSSDESVTQDAYAGKIKGFMHGQAEVKCYYNPYNTASPIVYTAIVYVEEPQIVIDDMTRWSSVNSGKTSGTLSLNKGDVFELKLDNTYQAVTFNSNKPTIAFADESGTIYARGSGTAVLSAKVNGTKLTIKVNVK